MTQTPVSTKQRFRRNDEHCPICGGYPELKQGKGVRCAGYLSRDEEYAYCTREEHAGSLERNEKTTPPAFGHKLYGDCNCGKQHNPPKDDTKAASNGHKKTDSDYFTYDDPRAVAHFPYYDEESRLLYVAVRYEWPDKDNPKGHSKTVRFFHKEGTKWVAGISDIRRVLYRLLDVLKADKSLRRYIVEGENKVEVLRKRGLIATCNPMGVKKWQKEYSAFFKDCSVIILPDNDADGKAHAEQVSASLKGIAASVKIVELPDLPEKGDVIDWLAAGGTTEQLEQLCRPPLPKTSEFKDLMTKELPPIRWIVQDMIAEGLTILGGKQKLGKSWLLLALGLAVAMGQMFLESIKVEQCEVLYLALEDNERRLQDRLRQILPPGTSVPPGFHFATKWPRLDFEGLQLLHTWLDEHPRVKLVIIDTWGRAKPLSRLKNGYDADIDAASGVQALAIERNISILATCHLRKAGAEDALDELNATTGLSATADNILILKRERGQALASLFGTGREIELDQALSFDDGHWKLLGDGAEYRLSKVSKDVIDVLTLNGAPMWPRDIAAVLQEKENTIRKRLFDMKTRGEVVETDKGYISNIGNAGNGGNTSNGGNGGNTQQYKSVTSNPLALPALPLAKTEVTPTNGHQKPSDEGSVTPVTPVTPVAKEHLPSWLMPGTHEWEKELTKEKPGTTREARLIDLAERRAAWYEQHDMPVPALPAQWMYELSRAQRLEVQA